MGSLRLQSAVDLDRRVDVDAFLLLCWRFLLLGSPQWSGDLRRRFGGERGGRQTLGKSARESALSASVRASDEFVASYNCAATVYRLKESNRQPVAGGLTRALCHPLFIMSEDAIMALFGSK